MIVRLRSVRRWEATWKPVAGLSLNGAGPRLSTCWRPRTSHIRWVAAILTAWGSGVHAAARIGALAAGEEILASRATLEAARPVPHGPWRTERLRGFRAPVEVTAID